jgi:hypothetical protein
MKDPNDFYTEDMFTPDMYTLDIPVEMVSNNYESETLQGLLEMTGSVAYAIQEYKRVMQEDNNG